MPSARDGVHLSPWNSSLARAVAVAYRDAMLNMEDPDNILSHAPVNHNPHWEPQRGLLNHLRNEVMGQLEDASSLKARAYSRT